MMRDAIASSSFLRNDRFQNASSLAQKEFKYMLDAKDGIHVAARPPLFDLFPYPYERIPTFARRNKPSMDPILNFDARTYSCL